MKTFYVQIKHRVEFFNMEAFVLLFRSLFRQNVAVDFKSNHGYGIKAQIHRWDDFLNCYIRPNFQFGYISLYFFLPSFIRKSGKRNPKL